MNNVEIVRSWESAMQRSYDPGGDMPQVLAHLSPDIEVIEADSLPYAGTYRGHEGFRRLGRIIGSTWEFAPGKHFDYVAQDDIVVVLTSGRARARSTGREVDWRLAEVCTLDDGLITGIRPYYWDTHAILEALR